MLGEEWAGARGRRLIDREIVDKAEVVLMGVSGLVPTAEYEFAQQGGLKLLALALQ